MDSIFRQIARRRVIPSHRWLAIIMMAWIALFVLASF